MKKISLFLVLLAMLCTQSYCQNEKCRAFSYDMIADIKGKIMSEYVCIEDENLYVIKAEVLPAYTIDAIKAACDSVPKEVRVISDWKVNYDKNYEKKLSLSGKNILVTFYPNDKIVYFEFPAK